MGRTLDFMMRWRISITFVIACLCAIVFIRPDMQRIGDEPLMVFAPYLIITIVAVAGLVLIAGWEMKKGLKR